MSVLKIYTNDLAGKKSQLRDVGGDRINSLFKGIKANFELSMKNQWTDDSASGGLTIQQKFDAYGTDAAQLFSIASATATMLNTIDPTYVPITPGTMTPSHTFTINQDGTVTVNS